MKSAANPGAYVASLTGWQHALVKRLRSAVRQAARLDESVKWGHLVYAAEGPVLLIRAEEQRVLLGFWRGKRLCAIEPRLVPSGKYEMATLVLEQKTRIDASEVGRLTREAVALNEALGDPRLAARRTTRDRGART